MRKRRNAVIIGSALAVAAIIAGLVLAFTFVVYYPATIAPGKNFCLIGRYDLAHEGMDRFQEIAARSADVPETSSVEFLQAEVDHGGAVISFSLSLGTFDTDGSYLGSARYTYADRTLTYEPPAPGAQDLVPALNPNSTLDYLDGEFRRIPLAEQIAVSGLDRYFVQYQPHTLIEAGTPLFDGRGDATFEPLGPADYNAGKGGMSDGATNVVVRLYNGQSLIEGQQYLYVFDPVEEATAVGNQLAFKECDYLLNSDGLKFTTNYGQDWIASGLTQDELDATLEFYQTGWRLPPTSLFLSSDHTLPLAYFYGGSPVLKLSSDGGDSWASVPFPTAAEFGRAITRRVIGFTSPQVGYAALGTEWSMGGGEHKMGYFTTDGGQTWTPKPLPLTMSSSTLLDLAMADELNGVLALDAGADASFSSLFATTNAGESWQEIQLPYDTLPLEVAYLTDIVSLAYENGRFSLVMGQSDDGTAQATFTSTSLLGSWELADTGKAVIHTIG